MGAFLEEFLVKDTNPIEKCNHSIEKSYDESDHMDVKNFPPCWRPVEKNPPYRQLHYGDVPRIPGVWKIVAAALPLSKACQLFQKWQGRPLSSH